MSKESTEKKPKVFKKKLITFYTNYENKIFGTNQEMVTELTPKAIICNDKKGRIWNMPLELMGKLTEMVKDHEKDGIITDLKLTGPIVAYIGEDGLIHQEFVN
jgi:hypothetical protein